MKQLTIDNHKELLPFIHAAGYGEYNSNIVTMLMWKFRYPVWFTCTEHYALVCTETPSKERAWLMPYCRWEYRQAAIAHMRQISEAESFPFTIHSMTKEYKDWLMHTYPNQHLIWSSYDAQDYVYDRFQQESLTGKKMQKRRNHYNAFLKQYGERAVYKPLEEKDLPAIYAFLKRWQQTKKTEEKETIDAEECGIRYLFAHFDVLPLLGGCIYIDGQLEAFSIASLLSADTVQLHVEKANKEIRGLYVAILKWFLETLDTSIRYINREDDMGLEELRKAKSDMKPICKIEKFAACATALHIQQADASWLPHIQQLWQQQFQEETAASSALYFQTFYKQTDCWLLTHEQTLLCMVQARPLQLLVDGKNMPTSLIYGVATHPQYEGCGYMRVLLEHVLGQLAKREKFTLIQAYDWELYRSFGFHEQYMHYVWKLRKEAYPEAKGQWQEAPEDKELLRLYEAYITKRNGARLRDTAWYALRRAYAALWQQRYICYAEDGDIKGYLLIEERETEIYVRECIYDSEASLRAMMGRFHEETRNVFVITDEDTLLEGRCRKENDTMCKEHGAYRLPTKHLYFHEEL